MKLLCVIILIISSSFLFAGNNKKKELEISIICGYGDVISSNAIVEPIIVIVKNNGKKLLKGKIDLDQTSIFGFSNKRIFRQEIILPANSNKLFRYCVRLDANLPNLRVKITTKDKIFEKKKDYFVVEKKSPIWINWYKKLKHNKYYNSYKERYFKSDVPIQLFPENLVALNHVDVMYFPDIRGITLSEKQQEVLYKWVQQGGMLLFASALAFEEQIINLTSFSMSLSIVKPYGITKIGAGRVICFAQQDGPAMVIDFFRNTKFIKNILLYEKSIKVKNIYYQQQALDKMAYVLKRDLVAEIDYSWMIFLLLGYLFCIGPLDYMLTKKLKIRMLTWWIYIISIIVFSILVYVKGYLLKSGPMKQMSMNFVDVCSETQIEGKTIFGIYSTRNASYTIKGVRKNVHFFPFPLKSASDIEIFSFDEQTLKARIPIYSSKNYICSWQDTVETYKQKIKLDNSKTISIDVPKNIEIVNTIISRNKMIYTINTIPKEWSVKKLAGNDGLNYIQGEMFRISSVKNNYENGVKNQLFDMTQNKSKCILVMLFFKTKDNYITLVDEDAEINKKNVLRYIVRED